MFNEQELVEALGQISTRNDAGQHFTQFSDCWEELEARGLIKVHRPVHDATGIPYSQEYWSLEVTEEGQELIDAEY